VQLAIVSDTHMPRGARRLPDACVAHLERADAILHAGDWMRTAVVDQIEAIGPPVYGIVGNVDDLAVAERLPVARVVELGGARIGMVHDPGPKAGRLARLRDRFRDADAVVYGHTHQPEHLLADDGFQGFNPGSPTERRRAPTHTMGLATISAGTIAFELVEV
jgi:uncharacterized protein